MRGGDREHAERHQRESALKLSEPHERRRLSEVEPGVVSGGGEAGDHRGGPAHAVTEGRVGGGSAPPAGEQQHDMGVTVVGGGAAVQVERDVAGGSADRRRT